MKQIVSSLDEEVKDTMALHMKDWQQRRRGGLYDAGAGTGSEGGIAIPLGQGEWDEGLGIPLCVVCHSVRIYLSSYDARLGRCSEKEN